MPTISSDELVLPSKADFLKLAREYSLVPVYRTLTADLETPVSAFLRITQNEPECFLLESVEGGEKLGRYTFIGIQPYKKILSWGRQITIREGRRTSQMEGDIFALLKESLSGHTPARIPGLPPFSAGAVGVFAYDVVRQIEKLPDLTKDEQGVPDACLMFFDEVLAFDHVRKEILLIVTADVKRQKPAEAYQDAIRRLGKLEKRLMQPLPRLPKPKIKDKLKVKHRTRKNDFLSAVSKAKEYIAAGDIFQVVLSQRFDVEPGVDPFSVYRSLRMVNPSPYMYFLRIDMNDAAGQKGSKKGKSGKKAEPSLHLLGASPELLVRVNQNTISYRPIAGTRRRSFDEAEDVRLEQEMLSDAKERAEHVMLVDLGRNDVGRVSEYGSVRVNQLMTVERYSHVMHIVSAIEGKLRDDLSPVDAFRACFPAGTLSGAPKVRAMEVIEELEPSRRGIYGGSVLYADFSGNLDSCIAIRSMTLKGKQGYVQAGAGIVADSVPELEYEECWNKAQAVLRSIERSRQG